MLLLPGIVGLRQGQGSCNGKRNTVSGAARTKADVGNESVDSTSTDRSRKNSEGR